MSTSNPWLDFDSDTLLLASAYDKVVPHPDTPSWLLDKGRTITAHIQQVVPEERLPGRKEPYCVRADQGERYLVAGTIVNVMARAQESGDMFEIFTITGGKGAGQPLHRHAAHHVTLYLLEGEATLWLDGDAYLMKKGDFASVPEGTSYGFRFAAHRTKLLMWCAGTGLLDVFQALGEATDCYIQPDHAELGWDPERQRAAEAAGDVVFESSDIPEGASRPITAAMPPSDTRPYTLAADEGRKFSGGPEYFALLATQENTGGKFFVVMSQGPETQMVPRHYHRLHSENFFCVDGALEMIVNRSTLSLAPGDFASVPAGTIHSYRMARPFTRFMGFLTPGLFQNFFETLGEPDYDANVYPAEPGALRIDRVIETLDQLDLVIVEEQMQAGDADKA